MGHKSPYHYQSQKRKGTLSCRFQRQMKLRIGNKTTQNKTVTVLILFFLHSAAPCWFRPWPLAHERTLEEVLNHGPIPRIMGTPVYIPHPLVLGRQGQNIEAIRHFVTAPWFRHGLERARALAGSPGEFSSNSVSPFASFNRSSVDCISSSASDFELAQMHCADGAVTSTGLELIKNWNILDQEEEGWPDLQG